MAQGVCLSHRAAWPNMSLDCSHVDADWRPAHVLFDMFVDCEVLLSAQSASLCASACDQRGAPCDDCRSHQRSLTLW